MMVFAEQPIPGKANRSLNLLNLYVFNLCYPKYIWHANSPVKATRGALNIAFAFMKWSFKNLLEIHGPREWRSERSKWNSCGLIITNNSSTLWTQTSLTIYDSVFCDVNLNESLLQRYGVPDSNGLRPLWVWIVLCRSYHCWPFSAPLTEQMSSQPWLFPDAHKYGRSPLSPAPVACSAPPNW